MQASTLQSNNSATKRRRDERIEKQQRQHDTLTEAMRVVGLQHGGVKWFAVVVRQMTQLARKWAVDGAEVSPGVLLRLILTADMSLSRADHPYNGALPSDLKTMLEGSAKAAERGPGYAAAVNPADVVSWTDLDRLLDGDIVLLDDTHDVSAASMKELDPTLPTWREEESAEGRPAGVGVDMVDVSVLDAASDIEESPGIEIT